MATYVPTGNPTTGAPGSSAVIRAEFDLIGDAFASIFPPSMAAGNAIIANITADGFDVTGNLLIAGSLIQVGAHAVTLTATGTTTLTLPTSGTLLTTTGNGSGLTGITAGQVSGLASIATSGSASDLSSGTVPAARITQVSTITSGTWQGSIIASTYGGTNNAFFQVSGPATSIKTYTFPNSSDTVACLATTQTFTAKQAFSGSTTALAAVLTNAAEICTVAATAATGTINYDVTTQSVLYYTADAAANWTLNVRGNGSNSLDSLMATGQSLTLVFMVTQGATAYYQTGFQIDGNAVTPKWQGGTGPTQGNVSSIDVYSATIIKTGSATFTVFMSQTRFA